MEEETEAEEMRSRLRLRRRLVKDIQDEIDHEDCSEEDDDLRMIFEIKTVSCSLLFLCFIMP